MLQQRKTCCKVCCNSLGKEHMTVKVRCHVVYLKYIRLWLNFLKLPKITFFFCEVWTRVIAKPFVNCLIQIEKYTAGVKITVCIPVYHSSYTIPSTLRMRRWYAEQICGRQDVQVYQKWDTTFPASTTKGSAFFSGIGCKSLVSDLHPIGQWLTILTTNRWTPLEYGW